MYQDPTKIRSHVVKLRFSDEEHRLVSAIVDYTGEQKATLLRDLVLERVREIIDPLDRPYESAHPVSLRA